MASLMCPQAVEGGRAVESCSLDLIYVWWLYFVRGVTMPNLIVIPISLFLSPFLAPCRTACVIPGLVDIAHPVMWRIPSRPPGGRGSPLAGGDHHPRPSGFKVQPTPYGHPG